MASDWPQRTLGELTENFDSLRVPVKEADRRAGPYPYYGASGIVDYVDGYLFDGEYLLIAEDGENLRTRTTPIAFIARGKFWVNNHAHIVTGNSEADTHFLMFALANTDISGYLTGSTLPKLTQGSLNRILVPAPLLKEQKAVASVLCTLDKKIELNKQMGETLRGMARTLFKSCFVDFDPVQAKADGLDLGVPEAIGGLYPSSFENSEIGAIPAGWRTGRFGDVVEHLREQLNPLSSPETVFHHYSIPAFDTAQWPKEEVGADIKSLKSKVPPNVILLSKLNPEIERVWLVDVQPNDPAICSTEFLVLRPRAPFGRAYAYCLARSSAFRQQIEALVTGTSKSHQRAQATSVLQLPVVLPPSSIVQKFEACASSLLLRSLSCYRETRTLEALRDTLLPGLVSGGLRISDPERIVGAQM